MDKAAEAETGAPAAAPKNRSLIAAIVAAVGASICCAGPFVLLMLGVSGAWIANLTALEPYRPIFIGATLAFLGFAFYRLYIAAPVCEPGKPCIDAALRRRQRVVFWVVTAAVAALIGFPWYGPILFS